MLFIYLFIYRRYAIMAMSDYNVNFDAMQQLIKEAESNTTEKKEFKALEDGTYCLLYTSPSPRD